jgi:hypothetical protein
VATRRLEELIEEARALAYSEQYSLTEGWNDNVVTNLFNLGLDKLYMAITEIDNPANIDQYEIDVVSGQMSYDIPIEVQMFIRIMDVRFIWGTASYQFNTLFQGMIQDRLDYPINIPTMYCIRDGKILLSPTPNITKDGALVVNYQKRMRKLDIRRGRLASFTSTPYTFVLTFIPQSEKDANLEVNATSVLDKIDYCCLVNRNGIPIVNAIPVFNYDFPTQTINALTSYVMPADELIALNAAVTAGDQIYVVSGKYSSTNSELDSQCEDFLIEFVIKRLLRLQSNTTESQEQTVEEAQVLSRLVNAYRRYRPSVYPVRWVRGRSYSSYNGGYIR